MVISRSFYCTGAQVLRRATNDAFYNRFVPIRYEFKWSLTPQPQPWISKSPRLYSSIARAACALPLTSVLCSMDNSNF